MEDGLGNSDLLGNGISMMETSDAVASVLPDKAEGEPINIMEFIDEQGNTVVQEEVVEEVVEEVATTEGGEEVAVSTAEEVVINGGMVGDDGEVVYVTTASGGDVTQVTQVGGEVGADYFVQDASEVNGGGDIIQMQEEEIIETPSSETEMSVAMEMAKLSQGENVGTVYTSPNINNMSVSYQEETYTEYSDSENTTPPPGSGDNIILPPTANVSGNRKSSSSSSTPGGTKPVLGADGSEKPRMSYAQLIAEALMSTEDRMLPLAEIYAAINKRYPYYR